MRVSEFLSNPTLFVLIAFVGIAIITIVQLNKARFDRLLFVETILIAISLWGVVLDNHFKKLKSEVESQKQELHSAFNGMTINLQAQDMAKIMRGDTVNTQTLLGRINSLNQQIMNQSNFDDFTFQLYELENLARRSRIELKREIESANSCIQKIDQLNSLSEPNIFESWILKLYPWFALAATLLFSLEKSKVTPQ